MHWPGFERGNVTVYPSALRLPVHQLRQGGFPIPAKPVRCAKIFPFDGSELVNVRGIRTELRLSVTVVPGAVHLFTEATVGHEHARADGRSRALVYSSDACHLPVLSDPHEARRVFGDLLSELARWTADLEGIVPDPATTPSRSFARAVWFERARQLAWHVSVPGDLAVREFVAHTVESRTNPAAVR